MLILKKFNDKLLIQEIKKGNKEALKQMYKDNYISIRNFILKNNGTENDVDDIVQDTCIVLWEKACHPDFELTSKLNTYAIAIAKNIWFKKLNKDKKMTTLSEYHSENLSYMSEEFSNQDKLLVMNYINDLGQICKDILVMFYYENRDMNEIAKAMNYNNSDTAKAKKHQCFKKLQDLILSNFSKSDFLGN